jgi:hypothetical protein
MLVFRVVFGLLLIASMLCFGASIVTGNPAWRRRGKFLLVGALVAATAFFAVLLAVSITQR